MKNKNSQKEDIWNIPNTLTFLRVLITFITVYFIFEGANIILIVSLFVLGMLTDFFDGQIARRFHQVTEFGRRFDMIADRFLLVGVALAFIINMILLRSLTRGFMLQLFLIMSREIISLPIAALALSSGKALPKTKKVGKATTVAQAVAFPVLILSVYYPSAFFFSFYLAILTSILGIFSAFNYITDVMKKEEE